MLQLYNYYRSTASYRVRIALNWKNLNYEMIPINLLKTEQRAPEYLNINPQGLVPALIDNNKIYTQSLSIIEYLEDKYPSPPLLPKNAEQRAEVRSLALIVACEMHPLNNLGVLQRLRQQFNANETQVTEWYHHWLKLGFDAFESHLKNTKRTANFCYGDSLTLADICLIPQVYNAHRFNFPMDNYPLITKINEHCLTLEPFIKAIPKEVAS